MAEDLVAGMEPKTCVPTVRSVREGEAVVARMEPEKSSSGILGDLKSQEGMISMIRTTPALKPQWEILMRTSLGFRSWLNAKFSVRVSMSFGWPGLV